MVGTTEPHAPMGSALLLARPVYYNIPLGIVHRLVEGKSPVSHVFWREFYNYGPPPLIALLPSAINAFIAGQDPTVNPEEWHVGSTPAQSLVALPTTESRPVGNPCSKFVIFSKAVDRVFGRSIDAYKTVEEVQEGFLSKRSRKQGRTTHQTTMSLGTVAMLLQYLSHAGSRYQTRLERN